MSSFDSKTPFWSFVHLSGNTLYIIIIIKWLFNIKLLSLYNNKINTVTIKFRWFGGGEETPLNVTSQTLQLSNVIISKYMHINVAVKESHSISSTRDEER